MHTREFTYLKSSYPVQETPINSQWIYGAFCLLTVSILLNNAYIYDLAIYPILIIFADIDLVANHPKHLLLPSINILQSLMPAVSFLLMRHLLLIASISLAKKKTNVFYSLQVFCLAFSSISGLTTLNLSMLCHTFFTSINPFCIFFN
jgi:hypothetical protein